MQPGNRSVALGAGIGLIVGIGVSIAWLHTDAAKTDVSASASVDAPAYAVSPQVPVTPAPRSNVATPAAQFADPAQTMAETIQRTRKDQERLEQLWTFQQPSAASEETRAFLEEVARSPLVNEAHSKPTSYEVECRASMCRLSSEFPGGESSGEWVTRVLLMAGNAFGNSSTVVLPGANGKDEVVLYAFLPGHAPPG